MIKLNNLNKFYNKHSRNEIHVVNNISLEFPKTGLVCLLGPSGSGKTTLLNVIGGLDSVDNGVIEIDGKTITRYNDRVWNYYRNKKFGYIFQNYLLLQDLTVYQNLELCIKAFNLSKLEMEERISYALKAVGMERFKNRKPTELSGGQQQRVSIARALIKSPEVYIADEPTGNIDESNTTQIMNILKKISQNSLIILVTHERRLAEFYGDRIIELKDGTIVLDYLNKSSSSLDRYDDNNIYLQDYNNEQSLIKDVDVNYFYKDQDNNNKLKLDIIFRNNTFYIHNASESINIKFLDSKSEIKVIDSKTPVFKVEDAIKTEFDLPKLDDEGKRNLNLKLNHIFKLAYDNIRNLKVIQKILIFMFFMASILITYGITSYNSSNYVPEESFLNYDRDLVKINDPEFKTFADIELLKTELGVDYFLNNYNYINIERVYVDSFYQRNSYLYFNGASIFPIKENAKPVMGRLPETPYEVVVDKSLLDKIIQGKDAKSFGLKTYEQFLDLVYSTRFGDYTIVGIVDNDNPVFYITEEGYKFIAINKTISLSNFWLGRYFFLYEDNDITNFELFDEEREKPEELKDLEIKTDEILVSSALYSRNGRQKTLEINGFVFDIIGIYDYRSLSDESIYIKKNQLDRVYEINLLGNRPVYYISDDIENDLTSLKANFYDAYHVYDIDYQTNMILDKDTTALFYSMIVGLFTLVFLYFIMRSSVISRSYSIGVLRALGVSRWNVIGIFVFEVILITLLSSFIGVTLFSIITIQINSISSLFYYPWYVPLFTFLMILIFNILIGILPVLPYLRKTPSQILSRFDM